MQFRVNTRYVCYVFKFYGGGGAAICIRLNRTSGNERQNKTKLTPAHSLVDNAQIAAENVLTNAKS